MPVKSYLVLTMPGKRDELIKSIQQKGNCEAFPAENKEVIVLVTDTVDEEEDKRLSEFLNALPSIKHLSLVSGFKSNAL